MSKRWIVILVVPQVLWLFLVLLLFALYLSVRYPGLRPNTEEFDLAIEGTKMSPSEVTIEEGDTAYLKITTDHPIEFRIPGLGFEGDLEPQGSRFDAVWGVKAERVGHFAIEDARTRTKLGVFVVRPD
jgi:hypothetical protein